MKGNKSENKSHPLEPLVDLYIQYIDVTEKSKKRYNKILTHFIKYIKAHKIKSPDRKHIIKYREYMFDLGYTANSVHTFMSVLKGFYSFLQQNQRRYNLDSIYIYDITKGIKTAKINNKFRKLPLTLKQAQNVLENAQRKCLDINGYRNYAVILLMITTGLRGIEIIRARKCDLAKLNDHSILYVHGKNRDEADEFVKVPKEVTKALNNYLMRRSDNGRYLFVSHSNGSSSQQLSTAYLNSVFKDLLRECGIVDPRITLHSLRHTAATFNLLRGGTLESTQQLLRHASIQTTMIYLHHINRVKDNSEFEIENYIFKNGKEVEDQ